MRDDGIPTQAATLAIGGVLIVIGILFLVGQHVGLDLGRHGWPLFIIVPGVVILLAAFTLSGEAGSGIAVLGSMVTATGLLLLYQDTTGHWESWAYAWALIAPGSVGVGFILYGLGRGGWTMARAGLLTTAIGLVLFFLGALFFEGVIGISGRRFGPAADVILPIALVGLGVLVIGGSIVPRAWWSPGPQGHVPSAGWTGRPPGPAAPTGPGSPWDGWTWDGTPSGGATGPGSPPAADRLSLDLGQATSAEVEINFGAGRLAVGPGQAGKLIDGEFMGGVRHWTAPGGHVRLWSDAPWVNWGWRRCEWRVGLPSSVPVRLRVQTGAAETELDLADLRVEHLVVRTGASETRVRLPRAAGFTRVDAAAGAASLKIAVPEGVEARIRTTMTMGSVQIDQRRFPPAPGGYASPGYDSAANRAEIEVRGGVGSLTIG
jgi:hypothetical protein